MAKKPMSVALTAGLLTMMVGQTAQAVPGDLLVTEWDGGSVLEFGQGGDLSQAPRFATGLTAPLGLCVGPGGHIYVAENVGGTTEITIITDGGDFTGVAPFATAPAPPTALWCDDQTLLVGFLGPAPDPGDPPFGLVMDASAGGSLLQTGTVVANQMAAPGEMIRTEAGTLYSANGDVWDITAGGNFGSVPAFTSGRVMLTIEDWGAMLLGGDDAAPQVVDFSAGGDLSGAPVFATLPASVTGIRGLLNAGDQGLFALTSDAIYDISSGGDLSGATPYATGIVTWSVGYQGMIEHVCSTDADCSDGDACNGAEICSDNSCGAPAAPLSCDDQDVCTADACDMTDGCSNEAIAGCCVSDAECAIDEICDTIDNECVPLGTATTVGGGDDTDGSSGGDPQLDSGGESDTGDDGIDAGARGEGEPSGCACRSQPSGEAGWWALVLIAAGWGQRRRPWAGRRTSTH